MAQATVKTDIAAPPSAVWPWIADLNRHAEWSPRPYRVELVSGESSNVGSRYRSVGWVPPNDSNHANDVEIVSVDPERSIVLHAHDENGTYTSTYTLRPSDRGTEVTWSIQFPQMKGFAAVMVPILFPVVAVPDFKRRLALLKAKVEAAA